jgi:hypothetical protein
MRAGRLDVLDLFASFWIKPKRRRMVAPENRLVKEAPVNSNKQKQRTDALPKKQPTSPCAPARTSTEGRRPAFALDQKKKQLWSGTKAVYFHQWFTYCAGKTSSI